MKMMTYRSDKKNKEFRKYFILTFVFGIIFFTPISSWFFDFLERPLIAISQQTQNLSEDTMTFFQTLAFSHKNLKENQELKKEVERLRVDNLRVTYLEDQLQKINQSSETGEYQYFSILSFQSFPQSDSFLIRGGKDQGVSKNDIVVSDNGFVIGYISDVYDISARVTAYSKPEEKVLAYLYPLATQIEAEGYGNGSFRITAPRDLNIQEGDILMSTEVPNTPIALVRAIEFSPQDAFQSIYLSYPESLLGIQNVRLVKNISLSL